MTKYTLYVGLFDKDSKAQEISTLDAFKIAANLFAEITGGATITEGTGVYTHDDGTVVIEPTLVCVVFGAERQQILEASEMLKMLFNQAEIAMESVESNSCFI